MNNDFEILKAAYKLETDSRNVMHNWEGYKAGATASDLHRLKTEGLIEIVFKAEGLTKYSLTEKARGVIQPEIMYERPSARAIIDAMENIIGFDDVKETIATSVQAQKKVNFLLEGPPACAKSLMLEAVRESVQGSYMAFGSRTSAAGLSEILFGEKPKVLLMDETDKMRHDVFSVLLGLMESGEIIETKQNKTRGIKLDDTIVIGACNSSAKMPPEFLSRFALHVVFPEYTRQEFIDVCIGFLTKTEGCPWELAKFIGEAVYDMELGDIRSARGVWQLVNAPTREEVERVIRLKNKYSFQAAASRNKKNKSNQTRLL